MLQSCRRLAERVLATRTRHQDPRTPCHVPLSLAAVCGKAGSGLRGAGLGVTSLLEASLGHLQNGDGMAASGTAQGTAPGRTVWAHQVPVSSFIHSMNYEDIPRPCTCGVLTTVPGTGAPMEPVFWQGRSPTGRSKFREGGCSGSWHARAGTTLPLSISASCLNRTEYRRQL